MRIKTSICGGPFGAGGVSRLTMGQANIERAVEISPQAIVRQGHGFALLRNLHGMTPELFDRNVKTERWSSSTCTAPLQRSLPSGSQEMVLLRHSSSGET